MLLSLLRMLVACAFLDIYRCEPLNFPHPKMINIQIDGKMMDIQMDLLVMMFVSTYVSKHLCAHVHVLMHAHST